MKRYGAEHPDVNEKKCKTAGKKEGRADRKKARQKARKEQHGGKEGQS